MRKIGALLLIVVLSACAHPASPAQAVYEAQSKYAAALELAVQYKEWPTCSLESPVPCSKPEFVSALQLADDAAHASLMAAQETVRNPAFGKDALDSATIAAQNAVVAFSQIVTAARGVK